MTSTQVVKRNKQSVNTKDRFIQGLKKYNLTLEEIQLSGWKYVGGDTGSHLNYYKLVFPNNNRLPPHYDNCVCGHPIEYNCYIANKTNLIVLGRCCIKQFVENSGRTCEECGSSHRNSKVNLCNDCK